MEPKINYQLELDKIIERVGDSDNRLLLHSCCGPCSSYVLEYLTEYFDITVLYYNPCIYPTEEYELRKRVQKELAEKMNFENIGSSKRSQIKLLDCDYDHESFLSLIAGHEGDPEGFDRCKICYKQRLEMAAKYAGMGNFDWFATTLTVSPHKPAEKINSIGLEISKKTGIPYLVSDFKKKNGYIRSIELSKVFSLYRQDYCGCEFSLPENR